VEIAFARLRKKDGIFLWRRKICEVDKNEQWGDFAKGIGIVLFGEKTLTSKD